MWGGEKPGEVLIQFLRQFLSGMNTYESGCLIIHWVEIYMKFQLNNTPLKSYSIYTVLLYYQLN